MLYLGTVVTGSGPHSGDLDARRTGLDPQVMSHVHAIAVYVLVALTLGLVVDGPPRRGRHRSSRAGLLLLGVELLQGLVGFTQYFLDLPEALVVLHLLGAALVSAASTAVVLSARARSTRSADERVDGDGDEEQREVEVRDVEEPHRVHERGVVARA